MLGQTAGPFLASPGQPRLAPIHTLPASLGYVLPPPRRFLVSPPTPAGPQINPPDPGPGPMDPRLPTRHFGVPVGELGRAALGRGLIAPGRDSGPQAGTQGHACSSRGDRVPAWEHGVPRVDHRVPRVEPGPPGRTLRLLAGGMCAWLGEVSNT